MKEYSTFVGMDVHKNSIEIAIAEQDRKGEVRSYGKIDGTLAALDKVIRKLVSKGRCLHFVYEAGPCGYEIYRHLTSKGLDCTVAAPSKIPRKSGDRIKNDRRDAINLARLHRAGDLTAVYVPHAEDEAMRDLVRGREDAKGDEKKAKQRLLSFLLRIGHKYSGKTLWSQAHMRWLAGIKMPHRAQQIVLQEYIDTLTVCRQRVERLTDQIREFLPEWRMLPVVKALQSLRGVSLIVAVTTVAEIGDLNRFESPVELMGYLGWCLLSILLVRRPNGVRSPKPVTAMRAGSWLKGLGPIGFPPESVGHCLNARKEYHRKFVTSHGGPRFGCVPATGAYGLKANPSRLLSPLSPENYAPSCGQSPKKLRSRSPYKT